MNSLRLRQRPRRGPSIAPWGESGSDPRSHGGIHGKPCCRHNLARQPLAQAAATARAPKDRQLAAQRAVVARRASSAVRPAALPPEARRPPPAHRPLRFEICRGRRDDLDSWTRSASEVESAAIQTRRLWTDEFSQEHCSAASGRARPIPGSSPDYSSRVCQARASPRCVSASGFRC